MHMKKLGILFLSGLLLCGCFSLRPDSKKEPEKESLKEMMEVIVNAYLDHLHFPEEEKTELLQAEFEKRNDEFHSVFFINAENVEYSSENDFIKRIISVENWSENGKLSYNTREVEFLKGYTYEISFDIYRM